MDTLSRLKQVRRNVLQNYWEKQAETTWTNRHELDELLQEIHLANLAIEKYQARMVHGVKPECASIYVY